jgi:hypothetical protein
MQRRLTGCCKVAAAAECQISAMLQHYGLPLFTCLLLLLVLNRQLSHCHAAAAGL